MARRLTEVDYKILQSPTAWFGAQLSNPTVDLKSIEKYRPAYREALSRMTTKTGSRLNAFSSGSFRANAGAIASAFQYADTAEKMDDAIANFTNDYKGGIASLESSFDQSARNRNFDDEDKREVRGKVVLRSRFYLAGEDTIHETAAQSISDVVQSDLFGWKSSNEDTGVFNSVHLDNKRHEFMMSQEPGEPRPPQRIEQLVLGYKVPEQWDDQQPITEIVYDDLKQQVIEAGLRNAGPVSVALADQHMESDPYGLTATQSTYLHNVNTLAPGLQVYQQGVPFGMLDTVGMRRTGGYESWYDERCDNQIHAIEPSQEGVRAIEEGVGFDVLY